MYTRIRIPSSFSEFFLNGCLSNENQKQKPQRIRLHTCSAFARSVPIVRPKGMIWASKGEFKAQRT